MHCDSLIGEEQRGQPDGTFFIFLSFALPVVVFTGFNPVELLIVKAVLHEPPRRVLAPLPFSPISVSDYLFPGEGPADSLASLADLLDLGSLLDGDVQVFFHFLSFMSSVSRVICYRDI
jgi:hypothetical protein